MKLKVLVVFGTRPEAIKMAPLVKQLEKSKKLEVKVCVTAQHRQMLDQVLQLFDITPDFDLNLMRPGQTLTQLTCNILQGMEGVFLQYKPDWVLVHGDTSTTLGASLAAYYQQVGVAHVEAGLRTHNLFSPWPEEANRQLTGRLAGLHFAPTTQAQNNLLSEGVNASIIHVTGNTVIDALLSISKRLDEDSMLNSQLGLDHGLVLIFFDAIFPVLAALAAYALMGLVTKEGVSRVFLSLILVFGQDLLSMGNSSIWFGGIPLTFLRGLSFYMSELLPDYTTSYLGILRTPEPQFSISCLFLHWYLISRFLGFAQKRQLPSINLVVSLLIVNIVLSFSYVFISFSLLMLMICMLPFLAIESESKKITLLWALCFITPVLFIAMYLQAQIGAAATLERAQGGNEFGGATALPAQSN